MLIGKRIKDMRLKMGMNQQQLGDLLGVTKVSICGYENGTRTPGLDTFCKMAEIFNTTTDYLLGKEIAIYTEEDHEYLGRVSKDDVEIIKEFRNNPKLYEKLTRDHKRYVNLINKKML